MAEAAATVKRIRSVRASVLPSIDTDLRHLLDPVSCGELISIYQSDFAEGTRQWVFDSLEEWAARPADDPHRRVFWVQGTGGLGKSVIAGQIVRRYGTVEEDESGQEIFGFLHLAGYFFCKYDGDASRNDPRRVLTTLAYRLTGMVPEYRAELQRSLEEGGMNGGLMKLLKDPRSDLDQVFEALLAQPLTAALKQRRDQPDIFLLIDAVDELHRDINRQQLLGLISQQLIKLPE